MNLRGGCLVLLVAAQCLGAATPESEALVLQGNAAFRANQREQAIKLFTEAVRIDPSNHVAYWNRGRIRENGGEFVEAIPDFNTVVRLVTNHAGAFQLRGATRLRLGQPEQALADFDRYIEFSPTRGRHHWQRGIALYLLGRYDEARQQYASCHAANTNDVENALWHFACTAKLRGIDQAELLPVGKDPREGMRELYALYAGKADTNTVLTSDKPVWAHFYLGLYYEAAGKMAEGREHIEKAAEHAVVGDFIGAVARSWRKRQE